MTRVAAVQMNSGDDVETNLQLTRELVGEARQCRAELVVLPECFALMAKSHAQRLACAEREKRLRIIEKFLSKLALNEQIWILAAGIFSAGPRINRKFEIPLSFSTAPVYRLQLMTKFTCLM